MRTLQDSACDRLIADGHANKGWALVLLAALEGDVALAAYLDGTSTIQPPLTSAPDAADAGGPAPEPPGVFVSSISVAGFRGIGPAASITFKPGPGLTLVVGRNGSGKSSFAEALECLFTGTSYRWVDRPAPWKTGWKNLHESGKAALKADLVVEGQGPLSISRVWHGDTLADAETMATAKGQKPQPLSALGWDASLGTFRPFLSYNELGSLLDEGPSKLYDALSSVLGLDELNDVQNRLSAARKQREAIVTASKNGAKELAQKIASVETQDDRCSRALSALAAKGVDLAAFASLIAGDSTADDTAVSRLRQIASLAVPDTDAVAGVVERLRSAERAYVAIAGTDAARARQRADLLEAAVAVHANHAQQTDCPVCGAKKRLETKAADTRGLWPRASALLARQSLEVALKTYWSAVAPGTEQASTRAQLLCLERYVAPTVARHGHQCWTALSRASHHHAYELPPTREELLGWLEGVGTLIDHTERAWRR